MKQAWQVYVISEPKMKMFVSLPYTSWYEFLWVWKKDVYISAVLEFATIQNEPNNLRPIVSCHVYNQENFGKPVINWRDFIYLGISKMSFTF